MRTFNTIEEIKLELIEGNLIIKESVTITCNIPRGTIYNLNCLDLTCLNLTCRNLDCLNLTCLNLNCLDLNCLDLDCGDLICLNLTCGDLNCRNLTCRDLTCLNLTCWDLNCWDLTCRDLTCLNLNCNNLSYNAICSSYNSISCNSYEIRRQNGHAPITLDGSLTIKNTESKDKLKEELQAIKSKINEIEKANLQLSQQMQNLERKGLKRLSSYATL